MAYELDLLAVGEESKSGDAITMRFGNLSSPNGQYVVVIDGGFRETGDRLVQHIRDVYRTTTVDLVISSHPDGDHSGGLHAALEQLTVRELWIHQPTSRSSRLREHLGRRALSNYVNNAIRDVDEIVEIARRKGIPIREPFRGLTACAGRVLVLGPSVEFYAAMVEEFVNQADEPSIVPRGALAGLFAAQQPRGLLGFLNEDWSYETLDDNGETSPTNNTSTIILVRPSVGAQWLFTADAGIPALTQAFGYAAMSGIQLPLSTWVQIPHHGSRRNVGPTILNRILGSARGPLGLAGAPKRLAYASCAAKGAPKHPSKRVLNAFTRRGFSVATTATGALCHRSADAPVRYANGWGPLSFEPIHPVVDDE